MTKPVSTQLSISMEMQNPATGTTTPSVGTDPGGNIVTAKIVAQETATEGNDPTNQSHTPKWSVYQSIPNTVVWSLTRATATTAPTWWAKTHILGIVVENARKDVANNPGGAGFSLPENTPATTATYAESGWAGPSAADQGIAADSAEYAPYLLLASSDTGFKLIVDTSSTTEKPLFNTSGKPIAPTGGHLASKHHPKQTPFVFGFRVYFYTTGIGVWYRDPELDLLPSS